jgi:hypothetical protein
MRARPSRLHALPWLLVLACIQSSTPPAASVGLSDREVIDPWLLCQDCTDGELDTVTAAGKLRPTVVETLSTDLLAGPSATRRTNIRAQVEQSFDRDTAYTNAAGLTPNFASVDYIELYEDNYVAVFRTHAGIALAAIGGPRAKTALDSAVTGALRPGSDPLRGDVQQAVTAARDTLWTQ